MELSSSLRDQFPALHQKVHGKPLVYLDNAATTQKPQRVLDRLARYYALENSNVHRGVHFLSQAATDAMEAARETIRAFMGARHTHEVIFVRGVTEAVNLVAQTWGLENVRAGDEVLVSGLEHHANLVPWQMLCARTNATLRIIPVLPDGSLDQDAYRGMLGEKTKLVAVNHISNALGTVNPVAEMIADAHAVGAVVFLDGAQSAPHLAIDVQALDADFYAISGHKMYGPTGIGVLYGKETLLDAMPPYQFGGDMIERVTYQSSTWNHLPHKFEAGTPHIAGIIGLGEAAVFLRDVGHPAISTIEARLVQEATTQLLDIPGLKVYGTSPNKASVVSFLVDGVHPYDLGTLLDQQGVAVRTGHHCAQPLMEHFGIPGTVRASFAMYNTHEDVSRLVSAVARAVKMLA